MQHPMKRREFLAASAATVGALAFSGRLAAETTPAFKTQLKPAVIGDPSEENFKTWREAGFEGVEIAGGAIEKSYDEAAKDRELAAKYGLTIHSVLFGWGNLNSKDPGEIEACQEKIRTTLDAARGFGASAVLVVPCRVAGMAMPQPWEFDIQLDEKTSLIKSVVAGDNTPYAEYIEAQNWATESSRKAIRELIPAAEKAGVVIALENVWNNLWVTPALAASFVKSFESPWVQAYFDVGNHVKYAKPTEYIAQFGGLIKKVHIKDFLLNADGHDGTFIDIREGSVDWPAVRKALDEIGYSDFVTIEASSLPLAEQVKRMNLIIAGQ